jgi:hypothetical protein
MLVSLVGTLGYLFLVLPPGLSVSVYKYYLVIHDDCTHYSWTFPLRCKFDTFSTLSLL